LVEEVWTDYLEAPLTELHNNMSFHCSSRDREQRLSEWKVRFLKVANHVAPELALQQTRTLNYLKNTETLWRSYARQLGFHNEDLNFYYRNTHSPEEYGRGNFSDTGIKTSRVQLGVSIENAIWLVQPISGPAELLQSFAEETRPIQVVLEPMALESAKDTVSLGVSVSGGYEIEGLCRISC